MPWALVFRAPDRGVFVFANQILQKLLINFCHHRLNRGIKLGEGCGIVVNEAIVLAARLLQSLKVLVIQFNVGLAVAVFNDVYTKVVDDFGIDRADIVIHKGALIHHLGASGILTVLAKVGDDVRKANNTALQGVGHNRFAVFQIGVAAFHAAVKLLKAGHGAGEVFLALNFTVVGDNAVEGLQADVERIDVIQYAHRLQIVEEVTPRVLVVKLAKIGLARVSKRRALACTL